MRNFCPPFVLIILLAMLICIASFGCNNSEKLSHEKQAAINAARHWIALIDSGRYQQSWEIASDMFKAELTSRQWRIGLEQIRAPYGHVKSRNIKAINRLENAANSARLVVEFTTLFENETAVTEFVTVLLEDDATWRVSTYYLDR